ncbi:hypothetical protein ACHHYP_14238 [Achlya hypogyna]|uniref:Uncharacterized protein n=1 Tax=Achlya hypogyna TaxID=1202772 RepID=A0A1V9YDN7_ACHHY|nr:hypothetical protein ACHHYP_14238 [Achlya hypogyna]
MLMLRELSESKTAQRAVAYLQMNAQVIVGCLGLSGITFMLARMEPWKLYLLACLGLVFLPVFLQQGAVGLARAQASVVSEVLPEVHEPKQKEKKTSAPQVELTVAQPQMPVVVSPPHSLSPSVSLKQDPILMNLPPLVLDARKGIHIMSKDVLHQREQLFARAMTSLRSLSPRNQPVVHHLDLIKYAEEIDDQNEDNFL